jgi:FkbM family methyltransferase
MTTIVNARAGRFMVLPNDALGQVLQEKGDFEPHFHQLAKNIIKLGDLCLDCGANLGYHTVDMARLTGPQGRVVAFEPLRLIYQQLSGNCFLNDLRNVVTLNTAIGHENGVVQMDAVNVDAAGVNIGGTKVGQGGDTAQIVKLDGLNFKNVAFMKIDVQGCEVRLLEGAEKTIAASRPVMFVEIENNWLNCFGFDSGKLMNRLLGIGYLLVRINTEYPCDHLAVPLEKEHLLGQYLKDLQHPYDIIKGRSVEVRFDRGGPYNHILYGSYTVNA